ncbi:hypothetical protein WDU94_013408 [Cyamophila willieti]
MTEVEVKIRTDVYRTAHPERRLPYSFRIPFIDETKSWSYEILYGIELFIMFQLLTFVTPIVYGMIVSNNIMISLCLYQMFVDPSQLSLLRIFKFNAELIAITMEYFMYINCSEVVDDCNGLVLKALNDSRWECCTNQTKRDLVMVLRRVQKPNHWRLCNGAISINFAFFLKVIKVAYTFVNFMQLKGNVVFANSLNT